MKVRKRPKNVEARVLTEQEYYKIKKWIIADIPSMFKVKQDKKRGLLVPTVMGKDLARYDDWIIREAPGVFTVHTPQEFFRNYESL